ncbi:MAG: ABC transporter ATP-binding protein [Arachnia sp.]
MTARPSLGLLTLGGLRRALGRNAGLFVFVIACNVLAQLSSAVAAVAAAWAVSAAVLGLGPSAIGLPTAVTAAAVVARSIFSWLESWLGHDLSFRMMSTIRAWVFDAIARLAPFGLGRRRIGDVATTTLTDSEALEIFYAHSSIYIASALVTTPLLWGGLAVLAPGAALAVAPVLIATALVPLLLRGAARRTGAEIRQTIAELGSDIGESIGAVREVVGFGLVDDRVARVRALDARLATLQQRNVRRAALESALGGVASVLCSLLAAAALAGGSVGSRDAMLWFAPSIVLAGFALAAILQWIGVTKHYGTTRQAARRIDQILQTPSPVRRSGTQRLDEQVVPDVAVRDVDYSWPTREGAARALAGVDFDLPAGGSLAIAGRSGAGKSTLAAVLSRFVEPDEGEVLVGGVALPEVAEDDFHRAVCTVPQDAYLFAGTIRENLLLAVDTPPGDDELWRALTVAGADELVRALPEGLEAPIGEGGIGVSGGERQRIALARALLRNPRILILDEAVSQLDIQSEHRIGGALAEGDGERTTVVVAHRLSTLLGAREILVVDEGRVVGRGSHALLLETCPPYRGLVRRQLEALS